MIILENGDKWIIDDSEIEDLDYKEACKGNVPLTSFEHFVERLCKSHKHDNDIEDESAEYLTPRKLTDYFDGGYWDCNFDVFKEVFGSIATAIIFNPWSTVYKMPWDNIIVVFVQADCGGSDVETAVKTYENYSAYLSAVAPPVLAAIKGLKG